MKIYVVETFDYDGIAKLGFSTSKHTAEMKCKEYMKNIKKICWVGEYSEGKKLWCEFEQ